MHAATTRMRGGLAVAVLLLALTGCGSDEEAPSMDSPSPVDGTTVDVAAVEYAYTASTTEIPAGSVTFELTNNGSMDHDLVLEEDPGGATDIIGAGETASFTVDLEPGTYTLYCSVGTHRAQGMELTITVTE